MDKLAFDGDADYGPLKRWLLVAAFAGAVAGIAAGVSVVAMIVAAVGVLLVGNSLRILPRWRRSRTISQEPIGSIAPGDGAIEVTGTAHPDASTTTAPFTDQECLAYTVSVEDYEYRSSAEGGGHYRWVNKWTDADGTTFLVDDGTGSAWVQPETAEYHLDTERQVELDEGERPPPEIRRTVEETDLVVVNDSDRRRYTEQRLDIGGEIHVSGEVSPAPDAGGPDGRKPRFSITDGEETPLFSVSSDPEMDVSGALLWRASAGTVLGVTLAAAAGTYASVEPMTGFGVFFGGVAVLFGVAAALGQLGTD